MPCNFFSLGTFPHYLNQALEGKDAAMKHSELRIIFVSGKEWEATAQKYGTHTLTHTHLVTYFLCFFPGCTDNVSRATLFFVLLSWVHW